MQHPILAIENVAPLDEDNRRRLDAVSRAGHKAWDQYMRLPPEVLQTTLSHVDFILRKWVLEVLLTIRHNDEIHYGAIARALGGLPSGSLTPKLQALEAADLICARTEDGKRLYSIAPQAIALANAIYVMTTAKSYHHASVAGGNDSPDVGSFTGIATVPTRPATGQQLARAHDEFAALSAEFYDHHATLQTEASMESTNETARRFAEACGRKWHGIVMICLTQGRASFSQLKEMAGMGDQALATTLKELQILHSIEQVDDGYQLAPFGVFDMSIGSSMVAMYERIAKTPANLPA